MAVHFHSLKIKNIKKETADCVSVSFHIPESAAPEFIFKEGQNITIKKEIDGQQIRRSYSICTAPYENELKVAIKAVDGGLFSKFANEDLQTGDVLEVLPPTGKFNAKIYARQTENFLAIAAGSGITPVISIIKHSLKANDGNIFTLIYGNKSRSSIIFFEELEGIKNKYMQRFNFINILSREKTDAELNYGRINTGKLEALKQLINFKTFTAAYICGPEEMIFSSAAFLENEGIAKSHIHYELFTTPGQKNVITTAQKLSADAGPKSNITVKLDGRSFSFDLAYKADSILDAALAQGADLPYACKGGVCCTCRAKLVEGKVHMDVNYALEEEELEQGFILCCQSHPLSEKVVVDFDVK